MSALDTVTTLFNAAVEKFANKFFDLTDNTLTGTTAQFNTALSDGDFVTSTVGLPLTSPVLTTPVINGVVTGTGQSAAATASTLAVRDANANLLADAFIPGSTSTPTAAGTTTLTVDSTQVQIFTGSSAQTVSLPTTGVAAGQSFTIINRSTGNVTINSSDTGNVTSVITNQVAVVTALQATPTTNAHWAFSRTFTISSTSTASTVPLRNGESNLVADNFLPGLTSTATAAGTTTMSVDSNQVQVFTGATTQTITLPSSSVVAGQGFEFYNESSGALTINSSAGNLVKTLAASSYCKVRAKQATPTADTHWAKS